MNPEIIDNVNNPAHYKGRYGIYRCSKKFYDT